MIVDGVYTGHLGQLEASRGDVPQVGLRISAVGHSDVLR